MLLDPNFLEDQDPKVEQVSSLLALASEHATQGYKLLCEAETFRAEAYSLVPKLPDSLAKALLCTDVPVVLPLSSSSSVLPPVVPSSSVPKHSRSIDDAMLVPSSKICHKSSKGLCIPEDFPNVWPLNLDPSYIGLEDKRYYECKAEGCSYTSSKKPLFGAMWPNFTHFIKHHVPHVPWIVSIQSH